MTTVVVVRKGGQVAIAGDSLVTFGDTRLAHGYEQNEKLFKVGESWIGMSGTTAHFPVLRRALNGLAPEELRLHPKLKDNFFLNTKEEDSDPYESSQFTALICNPGGIFGVYSYREVFEFDRFWGIGTGRAFALGAMYSAYDKARSAKEIAEIGVRAGCEFDKNSSGPVRVHTIKLNPA